ncbi:hypothetical protein LQ327_18835 [Actinomycetospora endophytica]|uniref:Uncharacterized protein n=1 Tax=Actinomycetospora endophytica TaxID=2291215 RepID=A0ABS8PAY3_9PSEU|nr:hypothetical protein [Actinomycetospora endophytica]MCD2195430.1 hypothetical protein [Actinomycetospora endophytica]
MSSTQSDRPVNTRLLLSGAVLTGVGGTLAAAGLACVSAAVIGAGRRWQQRTEMTPAQLARHAYGAAQTARSAGLGAWRDPLPAGAAPSIPRQTSTDGAGVPVS